MNAQASPVEVASREEAVLEHRQTPEMPVVKSFASFEDLPPVYQRLFDQAQASSFFHGLPWYRNLSATALESGEQIRILAVESQNTTRTPLAILPLRYSRRHQSAWRPRTLSSLSNYYTTVYAPLLDSSSSIDEALAQLLRDSAEWSDLDKAIAAEELLAAAGVRRVIQ